MHIKVLLVILSGIFWTIVYIDAIRIGFKQKTFAIPFWALALNLAWELLCSVFGYTEYGVNEQIIVNAIWFVFDIFIVITYFKYGFQEFHFKHPTVFYTWSVVAITSSFIIQYFFIMEFGLVRGVSYAAFLQNLLMSILFIEMLHRRQSSKGQSLLIAISKCFGTIAPTVLFGIVGLDLMSGPNRFILGIGIVILFFDLTYIFLLWNRMRKEKTAAVFLVGS